MVSAVISQLPAGVDAWHSILWISLVGLPGRWTIPTRGLTKMSMNLWVRLGSWSLVDWDLW